MGSENSAPTSHGTAMPAGCRLLELVHRYIQKVWNVPECLIQEFRRSICVSDDTFSNMCTNLNNF